MDYYQDLRERSEEAFDSRQKEKKEEGKSYNRAIRRSRGPVLGINKLLYL